MTPPSRSLIAPAPAPVPPEYRARPALKTIHFALDKADLDRKGVRATDPGAGFFVKER